ncbi:MAG: peptidoglycan DD-metalloendopeptidase family protein [Clostridiales bacterium]|nr:peptidoglycan DD-metalloendopeptidase family protein [Clostridiales bacterium]
MKQAERDHEKLENQKEELGTAGPAKDDRTGKPASWRSYIEQAEAAEKQAEREAAKARAAEIKAAKKRFQPKALAEKAQALAENARTLTQQGKSALDGLKDQQGRGQLKEKAAQAGKAVTEAAGTAWEKTCAFTAEGWDKAGRAMAKVRGVVDRHPISPLFYVTLLVICLGYGIFQGNYIRAYAMEVNGQEVAVVASEDEKDAIVSNIESRASDILGEQYDYNAEVSLTPVYVTPDELSDTAQVEDALFEDVGALMTAYSLWVDGQELGRAATQEELYRLLDEVAQPYLTEDTISYEFVETVEVRPIELPSNTQFDTEPVREILHQLEVEEAVYVVKKGDTFNAIAYSLGMMPNELSVLNPDVIVNKLWVDQELVIQQAVPYLSVMNVTDETYEEAIPSPVEYIETADLYVGDTKVKEQGEDGLALVNAHVTYVNGVEEEREIVQSTTLQEATTTYTYTGTTPRPKTASTGHYIWPVRGRITSNFGRRNVSVGSSNHLGIDIACAYGTAIKAADGGTVIKAGWEGTYGKLVAIRHDNGTVTYYAHNSSIVVSVGDKVYQGQTIARAGSTGRSTGNHCHFEVRINGTSVNPRNYLP